VRIKTPVRATLTSCLGAAGLILVTACGASQGSHPATSSSYGGPVPLPPATNFRPFPVPDVWAGASNVDFTPIQKQVTGINPHKTFRVYVHTHLVFWLSCLGTGTAQLTSPVIKVNWSVPCGTGADPAAITVQPPKAALRTVAKVVLTIPVGDRWEVRIDAPKSKAAPKATPKSTAR
jgi:hypothetical protein